ncbi:ATP-dependent Clp protease proteolytic subunit [Metallumcola ferriviriculae]|uniref:ATP-dependent Clp protease proteolytic subunit n=1 Tax=Metallumcola ferriviriculae TaxID=3039180 RepID=A0AAU0UN42_9FIRM|nr:ATP-dependent Clp protease proteolytic subunit [Desulfitibacteraceae bacterium MK1]
MRVKKIVTALTAVLIFILTIIPVYAASNLVYVIPVNGVISKGLSQQIGAGIAEAEKLDARAIMLEIDTPGGAIDAAMNISKKLTATRIPTISFISGDALSAGALIAFSTKQIAIVPGGTIGAAEPRQGSEKADEKIVSAWTKKLAAAAQANGRDPKIAGAMSDADIEIPGLVAKGKLLTLTHSQARETGMVDAVVASRQEALEEFNYGDAQITVRQGTIAERLARWTTHPYISPILLMVGMAGLLLEVLTVGFGVAGTIGMLAMALFFGGHYLAGASGAEAVLMFLVGLILLAMEILVIPGFGIAGIGGILMLIVSIFLASVSVSQAITSLLVAVVGSIALLLVSIRFLPTRRWWQRFILSDKQERSSGYLSSDEKGETYLGKEGRARTPLRPAGTVDLEGEPIDVVTDQGFIPRDTMVKVVRVEGRRIVVRKSTEGEKE